MPRLLNFVFLYFYFLIVVINSDRALQDHDVTSTQLVRSATNSFCFPKQFGPVNNPVCISWLKEGKNYTFQLICSPDPDFSLQWCGIGFSTLFPKPLYWRMFPSEIIMLQLVNENGKNKTVLTDRYATSSTLPPCMKRQITQLKNSTVEKNSLV